ncbi:hypothetical protein CDAR_460191 [Caerostris darwini]|uniref:Uncharacterized protein n=1 Tax=Caerostris darwini TaxID=1538125 RepID=A0AAV4RCQ6_9ARAC|nr:hypothetical protein CDAR_460191 [Caerostris darwini]
MSNSQREKNTKKHHPHFSEAPKQSFPSQLIPLLPSPEAPVKRKKKTDRTIIEEGFFYHQTAGYMLALSSAFPVKSLVLWCGCRKSSSDDNHSSSSRKD